MEEVRTLDGRVELRVRVPRRDESDSDLVGLRDHHHRRLRRSVPGDQCRQPGWRFGHDRRRGLVRHPQRVSGQHIPHAAEEGEKPGAAPPMPTAPRLSFAELKRMMMAQERARCRPSAKLDEIDKLL